MGTDKVKAAKLPLYSGCIGYFPRALREVARTSAYGARKHSDSKFGQALFGHPWSYGMYTDALCRHLDDEAIEGPVNAADSEEAGEEILHAAQVAWNALVRLEILMREREKEPLKLPEAPLDTNTDTVWTYDRLKNNPPKDQPKG